MKKLFLFCTLFFLGACFDDIEVGDRLSADAGDGQFQSQCSDPGDVLVGNNCYPACPDGTDSCYEQGTVVVNVDAGTVDDPRSCPEGQGWDGEGCVPVRRSTDQDLPNPCLDGFAFIPPNECEPIDEDSGVTNPCPDGSAQVGDDCLPVEDDPEPGECLSSETMTDLHGCQPSSLRVSPSLSGACEGELLCLLGDTLCVASEPLEQDGLFGELYAEHDAYVVGSVGLDMSPGDSEWVNNTSGYLCTSFAGRSNGDYEVYFISELSNDLSDCSYNQVQSGMCGGVDLGNPNDFAYHHNDRLCLFAETGSEAADVCKNTSGDNFVFAVTLSGGNLVANGNGDSSNPPDNTDDPDPPDNTDDPDPPDNTDDPDPPSSGDVDGDGIPDSVDVIFSLDNDNNGLTETLCVVSERVMGSPHNEASAIREGNAFGGFGTLLTEYTDQIMIIPGTGLEGWCFDFTNSLRQFYSFTYVSEIGLNGSSINIADCNTWVDLSISDFCSVYQDQFCFPTEGNSIYDDGCGGSEYVIGAFYNSAFDLDGI